MAKEFQLDISDMFLKGLRPEGHPRGWNVKDAKDKIKYLETAMECIVEKEHLSVLQHFIYPFTTAAMTGAGLYYTWPYGQAMDSGVSHPTDHTLYWFGKNDMELVTVLSDTTFSSASITLYTPDGGATDTISGAGPWKFAYFNQNFWLAFNGTDVIMKHQLGVINPKYADTLDKIIIYNGTAQNDVAIIKCGTEHRGRLLLANFAKGMSTEMKTIYDRWNVDSGQQSPFDMSISYDDWQTQTVWWSSIGGGDALELFYPDIVKSGSSDTIHFDDYGSETDAYKFRRTKQNQSGWMVLPYHEPIVALTPIGKNVIVQTRKHTGMLTLQSKPIATYGFEHIADIGLQSPTSVCLGKNGTEVFFVSSTGNVCCVNQKGKLEHKNYRDHIKPEITNIVLNGEIEPEHLHCFWDTSTNRYVISMPNKSLILTETGMSETSFRFTGRASLHPLNSVSFPAAVDNDIVDNCWITGDTYPSPRTGIDLQTDAFSFAPKGLCRLNWVQINFGSVGNVDLDPSNITPVIGRSQIFITVFYKSSAVIYAGDTDAATVNYSASTHWRKKTVRVLSDQVDSYYFGVEGYYFKIRIHTLSKEIANTVLPDSVNLRWQLSDKRFTRGAY